MKKILKLIIFASLIAAFIYFGTTEYEVDEDVIKNEKNTNSILINKDTVFKNINHSKVLNRLSTKEDSIIYIAVDGNKICTKYGLLINEIAKTYGIDTIYYYDIKEDKTNNNGTYQKILTKLTDYLLTDDLGEQDLYAPTLIFIKNGLVYSFDDDLGLSHGKIDVDKIWIESVIEEKTNYLNEVMEGFLNNE